MRLVTSPRLSIALRLVLPFPKGCEVGHMTWTFLSQTKYLLLTLPLLFGKDLSLDDVSQT